MSDEALFEIDSRDGDALVTHVLMPNMAYACGGNILTRRGAFRVGVSDWHLVTCGDCRSAGRDALSAEIQRQQGDQAGVQ